MIIWSSIQTVIIFEENQQIDIGDAISTFHSNVLSMIIWNGLIKISN